MRTPSLYPRASRPRSSGPILRPRLSLLLALAVLVSIPAFFLGRSVTSPARDPVGELHGVPVGVERTRAGAVAAAENYLATEQATVEREPSRFAKLVATDYVFRLRAGALTAAKLDRLRDPRGISLWSRGGQSFTVIGAARLDWYRGDGAQVTTWAGQIFWGPGQQATQVWSLDQTTLIWRAWRWQVSALRTLPQAAPTPSALPQAAPVDDTAAILDASLTGFTAVSYGAPG